MDATDYVPADGQGLGEDDVRQIVRLLADVAVLRGDLVDKKRALMAGLMQLVEADGWLWTVTRVDAAAQTPISVGLLHDGLSAEQVAGWLEASQTSCPPPEDAPFFEISRAGKHFTRRRQQVVSDEDWYSHPAVRRHRLRHGLDHFVYSVYPLDEPETFSGVGLFRRYGRPPFTSRDARLAHIVTSEVEWLHYADLPGERGRQVPQLTPRQRVVLMMLVDAHSKDEIAALLHISPHTVKDHIKAIYKLLGVSSQLELIRRFHVGDRGDEARSSTGDG